MDDQPPATEAPAVPEVAPNRAERRAKKFKRGIASPTWGSGRMISTAAIDKATACRPFTEQETATAHALTALAWQALQDGSGTEDDFDRVGKVINLAKIRALEIDEGLADELEQAQDAMTACKARYTKHGRFGFTGPELQVMHQAMAYQVEIVNASSAEQMRRAFRVMRSTIYKQTQQRAKQGLEPMPDVLRV